MNFDEAVQAHSAWKMKLSNYLRKPDGSIKAADVQQDSKCNLGAWIYGEGKKFSSHPEYEILKAAHAKFHQAAADVIRKADSGKNVTEDVALGAKSDYASASNAVITAIISIRRKVEAKAA